jgi:hypothetical protein
MTRTYYLLDGVDVDEVLDDVEEVVAVVRSLVLVIL